MRKKSTLFILLVFIFTIVNPITSKTNTTEVAYQVKEGDSKSFVIEQLVVNGSKISLPYFTDNSNNPVNITEKDEFTVKVSSVTSNAVKGTIKIKDKTISDVNLENFLFKTIDNDTYWTNKVDYNKSVVGIIVTEITYAFTSKTFSETFDISWVTGDHIQTENRTDISFNTKSGWLTAFNYRFDSYNQSSEKFITTYYFTIFEKVNSGPIDFPAVVFGLIFLTSVSVYRRKK